MPVNIILKPEISMMTNWILLGETANCIKVTKLKDIIALDKGEIKKISPTYIPKKNISSMRLVDNV